MMAFFYLQKGQAHGLRLPDMNSGPVNKFV
jgi:hypothetical protein